MGKQLLDLGSFHGVNSRKNVGIPVDWIDAVAFAGSDEREVNGYGFRARVGACEEAVFSHQYPAFDSPFRLVVIYGNIRIFEKSREGKPVVQGVVYGFHEFVGWMEVRFSPNYDFSQKLYKRLRVFAPYGQPEGGRFVFDVPLDFVQMSVDIEDSITDARLGKLCFEIFAPGVGAATSLDSSAVPEQSIEPAGGVELDGTAKVFEHIEVFVKRQIWRIVEHDDFVLGVTDVGCNFAFADVVFVLAVLNFDRRVVGFDDLRSKQLLYLQLIQQGECVGCGLHPVALGRARNHDIVSGKNLLLAGVGQPIIELADNNFCQEAWSGVATGYGRARLFGSDNVLLAFWARTSFLVVLQDFQVSADHLELMGDQVADEFRFDNTIWADQIFRSNKMLNWMGGQMFCVFQDVLDACGFFILRKRILRAGGFWLGLCNGGARVVLFSLLAEVTLVALLGLSDQHIQFYLQVFEQLSLLVIAIECLLQLTLQVLNQAGEALDFRQGLEVFFFQLRAVVFHEPPPVVS